MRFRYYRPDVVLERVAELGIACREYPEGMAELPAQQSFITEDEIDATLSRGGSNGRIAGGIMPIGSRLMLLRRSSSNLNQLTRRVNETGRLYEADLDGIREEQARLLSAAGSIVDKLSALK